MAEIGDQVPPGRARLRRPLLSDPARLPQSTACVASP